MSEHPENGASSVKPGVSELEQESLDYLRGVKSSTCLLLPTTPSPTPSLVFKHPLEEEIGDENFLTLNNDSTHNFDGTAGDSSSSADSNSVAQDPVSAQLINNISMLDYQTLSKNGDIIIGHKTQNEDCQLNGSLKANNRKLPSFVNWDWVLLRKILLWVVVSALVACLGTIVAMVVTIPKHCNPDLPWYQGKVFYEIFPASFKDSNNDGIGDLNGIIKKLDYIQQLGVSAIRLNYIFEANQYPYHYYNTTSLLKIDRSLGKFEDFQELVAAVHDRNISLVLDLPVLSMITPKEPTNTDYKNKILENNATWLDHTDPTSSAITFWARAQNVDGFYLKNLEQYVDDENFGRSLQIWKKIIGSNKILIANYKAYEKAKNDALNIFMTRIDLVDVHLDLDVSISGLKNYIDKVLRSSLWSLPHYPWVHWNIGDINNERISTKNLNNTLVLTVLEFILPGTVSLFYGDEIGLGGLPETEVEKDFHEHKHIHNLIVMAFSDIDKNENSPSILPWNSNSELEPKYYYLDVIQALIKIRLETPTIYLNAIYKDNNMLRNTKIRKTEENLVVIERWYPRRNTCIFVGNLGNKVIATDLSSMFYGGTVVASTNASLIGQLLYFEKITFPPNSALILKLEK